MGLFLSANLALPKVGQDPQLFGPQYSTLVEVEAAQPSRLIMVNP